MTASFPLLPLIYVSQQLNLTSLPLQTQVGQVFFPRMVGFLGTPMRAESAYT